MLARVPIDEKLNRFMIMIGNCFYMLESFQKKCDLCHELKEIGIRNKSK